jgi:predicted phosphohydrolase
MKIFAISDLHLSLAAPAVIGDWENLVCHKPMEIFGSNWTNFYQTLYENWTESVSNDDIVLMAGDTSWAMTLAEAKHDFAFLGNLPGKIIFIKGNHDYWWQSLAQIKKHLPANMHPLQHNTMEAGDKIICGTRGWLVPGAGDWHPIEDEKIYRREILRLEMALSEGAKSSLPLVAMLHFPPLIDAEKITGFCQLLIDYKVETCIYGHIHGQAASVEGEHFGINFINTSCDRIGMKPLLIHNS